MKRTMYFSNIYPIQMVASKCATPGVGYQFRPPCREEHHFVREGKVICEEGDVEGEGRLRTITPPGSPTPCWHGGGHDA